MKHIKILIADDHAIVRLGLTALFEAQRDFVLVGSAKDGEEAVRLAVTHHPDVVIMDLMMPRLNGVDATSKIKELLPDTHIIVLTSYGSSDGVAHALAAGASGALMKTDEDAELIPAIRRILEGQTVISPEIQQLLNEDPPIPELTSRQRDILSSLTRGFSNKDIAMQLGISTRSVDDHVNAILSKIGAANRVEAVSIALKKQLLKI